jgi:DNA-binding XRE family transcriptional regulator
VAVAEQPPICGLSSLCLGRLTPQPSNLFAVSFVQRALTQERFAEISGFSQRYVSSLEQGHRNPTVVTLYELATALGVSHLDLLMPVKNPKRI